VRRAALLLAPTLALFGLFVVAPILLGLLNSFRAHDFAGQAFGPLTTANYDAALGDSGYGSSVVKALALTAVKVPIQIALGLGAALLLAGNSRVNRLARSAVVLPSFVAIAVVGYLFSYLFSTDAGVVNLLLEGLGLSRVSWLQDPTGAQVVVLLTSLWRETGIVMLVFLAGLTAIPPVLIEAIKVDGATPWQSLRLVVLPLLQRSFQFAAVLVTILTAQLIVPVLLLTQGGPRDATAIAPYEIYERSFLLFDWGPALGMAMLFLLGVLALTVAELTLLRTRWHW
jgi:multiple sugar transport system permease protein